MKFIFLTARIAVILLLVVSCSNNDPSKKPSSTGSAPGNQTSQNLRIIFQWSGDDFATKQQLEARDKIAYLISERQIGKVIQSGSGMGWMDIVIEVKEKENAREKIEKIIKEILPDGKFTIRYDRV